MGESERDAPRSMMSEKQKRSERRVIGLLIELLVSARKS